MSTRALRRYETARLLVSARTSGRYRNYAAKDPDTAEGIRLILGTGLGVAVARRYLDCVCVGNGEATVTMCLSPRCELSELEDRLRRHSKRIAGERAAVARFVASSHGEGIWYLLHVTNLRPRPGANDLTLSEEGRHKLVGWMACECKDFAAQVVARACERAIAVAHIGGYAYNVERYTCKALSELPSPPNLNGSAP